jgi:hypothetical protein
VISKINKSIRCGAYSEALAKIEDAVDQVFCEPINVGQIFGSRVLDQLCQAIGEATLRRLGGVEPLNGAQGTAYSCTVYLASKLQCSGGHTAALIDTIRLSPPSRSIVIVSGTCGRTDKNAIKQKFGGLPNVSVEYVPQGNHLAKLEWIQRRLAELSPNTVWLFNHHQDSVLIAAVQPDQGYRLRFYHHGDHHLCLGVHLDYAEHFDPHPMGWHNCRENLGIQNNHYLPLVVSDYGGKPVGSGFPGSKGLVTCTAGGFNKVEVPYFIKYTDTVPEILHVTGGRHIHIGKLTPLARWRIYRSLRKRGVATESFVYIPYVPSVWRALHEYNVDVYVASFPYGGGRTLIEVMGAGVPTVIHAHCTSRMLGGFDMAYEGATIWRQPEELFAYLKNADITTLEHQGRLARKWYEKYHREEVLQKLIEQSCRIDVPPLRPDYRPDTLAQAMQNSREVTLGGMLYRMMWRNYRRWRRWMGRVF